MTFKILLTTLFLFVSSISIYSQNRQRVNRPTPPPVKERVETILETLTKNLELDQELVEKSDKIFTNYFKSLDDLRKEGSRPDRSKMESISKKRDADFEALLSDPQKKKYLVIKEELFQQKRRPNN